MDKIYTTKSFQETQKIGEDFAKEIVKNNSRGAAAVLALEGNLGGGKTTFLQGFAKGLGIKEKILSPTFVILKHFENFYHIDCYRLNNPEEILELDFKSIIKNPKNIVAVEWPEKIKDLLPQGTIWIELKFVDENKREIIFK